MGGGARVVDLVAESAIDKPGAIGFAGLEDVFDYFHAGGEEDGDGGEDCACSLVEAACRPPCDVQHFLL